MFIERRSSLYDGRQNVDTGIQKVFEMESGARQHFGG